MGREIRVKCVSTDGLTGKFEVGQECVACTTIDDGYLTVLDADGASQECSVENFKIVNLAPYGERPRKRPTIRMDGSPVDLMVDLSEGIIGAATVLRQMLQEYGAEALLYMMHLDDMNMRGSQIWLGYAHYCGSDLDKFVKAIKTRDLGMVAFVNKRNVQQLADAELACTGV